MKEMNAFIFVFNEPFPKNHLEPTWLYSNQIWGSIDEGTGKWIGAVGKVNLRKIVFE